MANPSALIVDDHEDAAIMLSLLLEAHGADCTVVHTAHAALEAMHLQQFDLAVVDIGPPELDGLEVARRARQLKLPPRRLVGLSGYGRPNDHAAAKEAGFDAYFVKPLTPDTLSALLP